MKIKLLSWDQPQLIAAEGQEENEGEPYLLKVGYADLTSAALDVRSRTVKPLGLVPPFDVDVLNFTFRCAATVRDHFPDFPIYAFIPKWCAREALRSMQGAGFRHFIFAYVEPWAFQHQVVHDLLREAQGVHVAGGDPKIEGWTWSEEGL